MSDYTLDQWVTDVAYKIYHDTGHKLYRSDFATIISEYEKFRKDYMPCDRTDEVMAELKSLESQVDELEALLQAERAAYKEKLTEEIHARQSAEERCSRASEKLQRVRDFLNQDEDDHERGKQEVYNRTGESVYFGFPIDIKGVQK